MFFHVSMLRKYLQDHIHMINHQILDVKHDLTYEDTPMVILDRNIHGQRNSFNQGSMVKPWSGRVNLKKGR